MIAFLVTAAHSRAAKHTPVHMCTSSKASPDAMNRRACLTLGWHTVAGLVFGASMAPFANSAFEPAYAAETGYLPKGAQTFQNIVGAQRQWDQLAQLVSSKGKGLSEEDWDSLRTYLRQAYKIGNDMETYTSTVANKDELRKLASSFRKQVKEMDVPGKNKDADEFYKQNRQVAELFNAFFAMLARESDMPDEL
ncbi:hypothetical protein FVE85_7593 [Porphyridium purpureum]|uniref:Uncharacterized protein n=1 Tax=Porphyridium purpureum TaxID=35688 RepID=A0A5J4ZAA1_PORPP|nr:hypothetical protein FVE85_7593 [Porphyridium purpureum]|eukprot:POR9394..scf295_1